MYGEWTWGRVVYIAEQARPLLLSHSTTSLLRLLCLEVCDRDGHGGNFNFEVAAQAEILKLNQQPRTALSWALRPGDRESKLRPRQISHWHSNARCQTEEAPGLAWAPQLLGAVASDHGSQAAAGRAKTESRVTCCLAGHSECHSTSADRGRRRCFYST